ncbi:hypothetical protein MPSEU_000701500 [Mayamaea pseudoterrestris]|nr:hypothetical protein MPSEU_000701500 [Mayamaea pseudoterrestris]
MTLKTRTQFFTRNIIYVLLQWMAVFMILLCILSHLLVVVKQQIGRMEQGFVPPRRQLAAVAAELDDTDSHQQLKHVTTTDEFYSTVHCVGENFNSDAWKFKSCQFRNLCFDTRSNDYVLFPSLEELQLQQLLDQTSNKFAVSSSTMKDSFVSLGTLTPELSSRQKWFPRIETNRTDIHAHGVYMLPENTLLVPYVSFQANHAGHLVWDDWFPIYLLASMFGLSDKKFLLVRSACNDCADEHLQLGQRHLEKYRSLLGLNEFQQMTQMEFAQMTTGLQSPYVCSKFGAAGLGMMASHLKKESNWTDQDYTMTHMVGYGALMWQFRTFVASKLFKGEGALPSTISSDKIVVTFVTSPLSAPELLRAVDSVKQTLQSASPTTRVQSQTFNEVSVKEQAIMVSQTTVMITDCQGDGLASAIFLPRGALLVLYCPDDTEENTMPAQLNWDLLNHAAYFRVHWLSNGHLGDQLSRLINMHLEEQAPL